jgi:hypothetical protein
MNKRHIYSEGIEYTEAQDRLLFGSHEREMARARPKDPKTGGWRRGKDDRKTKYIGPVTSTLLGTLRGGEGVGLVGGSGNWMNFIDLFIH